MARPIRRISEDYKDEEWLRHAYLVEELSRKDIGDICGVDENTVRYYANKYGIPSRTGKDRTTQRLREHLSKVNSGRIPWNAGMAGNYQQWTKYGKDAPGYKGGVVELTFWGLTYRKVLTPDHPHADRNGYVFEHRLVCEELLGRYLTPDELVHHRDGNSLNNDPSNLFIFYSDSDHMKFHHARKKDRSITEEGYCDENGCKYRTVRAA